ncbi:MAG: PSD1 domain-containing protein [Opitutaceae bacterium]|nr:PSD1 domain-containing protein [Opitutaceae bacterium]
MRLPLALPLAFATAFAAEDRLTFNEHIRPILSDNCFACHGVDAAHRKGKLRLDTADGATAPRAGSLPAVTPGSLEKSELWQRVISSHDDEVMPPPESQKRPLTAEQRGLIKRWIEAGATYQKHWAYEPVARPLPPAAQGGAGDHPVDRFIGAKLASRRLTLSPEAPRDVLLRRVTLDLTGLPPTADELGAFLADGAADAYERAVDRLLASPRYGEQFGRHWLDAVRYADTHGLHLDNIRMIWPYRDWVVSAFNRNLSFDHFTVEQIAGDLLPEPRIDQLVASGYNRNHLTTSEGGAIEAEAEMRNTADRTDTTAAVWLGLTANCASCHDHKFDPLTQREYYSLGAVFKGLADRVWDGNIPRPGPLVFLANPAQEKRLAAIAAALPPLQAALSARADALAAKATALSIAKSADPEAEMTGDKAPRKPVSYEVVWAEDGDMPTVANFGQPPPAGEWRGGVGVPLIAGQRALWLDGSHERPVNFAGGEVKLIVRTAAKAFVYLHPDAARPPRAVGLEFIGEEKTKRVIWGDPEAFGPDAAKNALLAGPMPPAGQYSRLEIDAVKTGLAANKAYTGLRLMQSDGAAWWDHVGVACASPTANADPLLTSSAWISSLRNFARDMLTVPLPHDIIYLIGVSGTQQNEEEKRRIAKFHRDYIYGPTRGALEAEARAVRELLVEQVHYEVTLPSSLVSRELPEPLPAHIMVRGQYDKPGDRVEPATPAFLPPAKKSGARLTRLDFARWLVDPANPLPARVTVNRFWAQLFGAGLVRTPADFGSQGLPPTHPELLDWLADEFVRGGWDVKKFVRLLVTSRAYRQSSAVSPALLEADPENKLLARAARPRLDAEVLRDQALALGGLLRPEIGGPPVRPYQPVNIWEPVAFGGSNTKTYVQDKGHALYRRSLYTFWKRTAPAPAMVTFDAPSRENFCLVRPRSNTPLQALALMNDVQQFEAARAFAERLLSRPSSEADRLAFAFRSVVAREPLPAEKKLLMDTLAKHRAHFAKNAEAASEVISNGESKSATMFPAGEFAAWTMVANLLLNLDESVCRN